MTPDRKRDRWSVEEEFHRGDDAQNFPFRRGRIPIFDIEHALSCPAHFSDVAPGIERKLLSRGARAGCCFLDHFRLDLVYAVKNKLRLLVEVISGKRDASLQQTVRSLDSLL